MMFAGYSEVETLKQCYFTSPNTDGITNWLGDPDITLAMAAGDSPYVNVQTVPRGTTHVLIFATPLPSPTIFTDVRDYVLIQQLCRQAEYQGKAPIPDTTRYVNIGCLGNGPILVPMFATTKEPNRSYVTNGIQYRIKLADNAPAGAVMAALSIAALRLTK